MKVPSEGDGRGEMGRPPELWNSVFITNLVGRKFDMIGNATYSGSICPNFKTKLQGVDGYSDKVFKVVERLLDKFPHQGLA